ncbi:hypothetical protein COBT_000740 [Conglomerata obtusa]
MTADTTSGPLQRTKNNIKKETDETAQIELLTKQNFRLTGEVAILRQNIVAIEKENHASKEKQHQNIRSSYSENEKIRKELKILQTENRIKENKLKSFKKPKNDENKEFIDYKWVLENVSTEITFSLLPFEYNRLKIINSYFYSEFEKLVVDHKTIIEEFSKILKHDLRVIYKHFILFCGVRQIFDHFLCAIVCEFNERSDCKQSKYLYKILNYVDLSWIMHQIENRDFMERLNRFLDEYYENEWCLVFYAKILVERPFLSNVFLSKDRFQKVLDTKFQNINMLLEIFPVDVFKGYIDHSNINTIDKIYLSRIYKEEYFDMH